MKQESSKDYSSRIVSSLRTIIEDMIAEEDRVACRLMHRTVHRGGSISERSMHCTDLSICS